jgi:flavin reductase (DIM6/NTAB) family NADH-FMN oxidoreductase RutF
MKSFREISPFALEGKIIDKICNEWMLLAAEKEDRVNMMTASWGGVGCLWQKPVTFTFFRPQRFTLEFVNAAETFSQCFFDEGYREKLTFCGSKSGRDYDKVKECGFTALSDSGAPYFAEAGLALICKKLYVQRLEPGCFLDGGAINRMHYPDNDHHYMFVSEILKILVAE